MSKFLDIEGLRKVWNKLKSYFVTVNGNQNINGGKIFTQPLGLVGGGDTKLILNNTDTETNHQQIAFQQNGETYGTLGTYGDDKLKWNNQELWHTGNLQIGTKLGNVVQNINGPGYNTLIDEGLLSSDYPNTHNIEEFFKAFIKWVHIHKGSDNSRIIWQGLVMPNSRRFCILHSYNDNLTNYTPQHCTGICFDHSTSITMFGYWDGVWKYREI